MVYRACADCCLVKGTREELREKRNADVEALKHPSPDYTPQYWPPATFKKLLQEHEGIPAWVLDKFRWQEYADTTWEGTKARAVKGSKHYQAEYYKKLRAETKEKTK